MRKLRPGEPSKYMAEISPIMIGGSGSSGTTLLSHLLDSHPAIYCGDELQLLNKKALYEKPFCYSREDFRRFLKEGIATRVFVDQDAFFTSTCAKPVREKLFMRVIRKYGWEPEDVLGLAAGTGTFKEFVESFFSKVLERSGKVTWAEKTPSNCFAIGEFLSCFPTGKYVHVVRDGRDAVPSLITKGFSAVHSVMVWVAQTAAALPYRRHKRYHEVKYEALVRSPVETLASLLGFLDAEYDPEILLGQARTRIADKCVGPSWRSRPDQPITAVSVGKWKREDYGDKAFIENLFRHLILGPDISGRLGLPGRTNGNRILELFGYDTADGWDASARVCGRVLKHYAAERYCELVHKRRSVFRFSLS